MRKILQTATFKRAVKRLHKHDKRELDKAVQALALNPGIGESKAGDLAGVRVHKFKINKQLILLAYESVESNDVINLLALGSHENFYRDLKR